MLELMLCDLWFSTVTVISWLFIRLNLWMTATLFLVNLLKLKLLNFLLHVCMPSRVWQYINVYMVFADVLDTLLANYVVSVNSWFKLLCWQYGCPRWLWTNGCWGIHQDKRAQVTYNCCLIIFLKLTAVYMNLPMVSFKKILHVTHYTHTFFSGFKSTVDFDRNSSESVRWCLVTFAVSCPGFALVDVDYIIHVLLLLLY